MISLAVFLVAFIAFAILALTRHPIYGVWLYIGAIFIHPPSRWWAAMLPDLRWSLMTAVIALLALYIHRKKIPTPLIPWHRTVPGVLLLMFVVWLWIQNAWALDKPTHFGASVQYTKLLIAFYLFYRVATTVNDTTDMLIAHVLGCMFLGLVAHFVGRDLGDRLNGVGGPGIDDANSLGMYFSTALAVGGTLLLAQRRWRALIVLMALPVILNGLILTGSRGAFLGFVIGALVIAFLRPPKRAWRFWGGGALAVVAGLSLVDAKFIDRVLTLSGAVEQGGKIDGSAENRMVLLEAQARMAAGYPHGAGHRGTAALSPQYLDRQWLTTGRDGREEDAARSSHNTFMTVLVEQGIPGLLIYASLCLWGLMSIGRLWLWRKRMPPEVSAPAVACTAAMAVIFTAGQFTDYLLAEVQIWMLALLAASMQHAAQAAAPKRLQQAPRFEVAEPFGTERANQ